jgi:hypothetical protein
VGAEYGMILFSPLRVCVLMSLPILLGCGDKSSPSQPSRVAPVSQGSQAGVDVLDEYDLKGGKAQLDRYTRLYDPATVVTVQGALVDKENVDLDGDAQTVLIELSSAGGFITAVLAPENFLNRRVSLGVTDQVEVTGSRVMLGGRRVIVARSIRKGSKTVGLREESGRPLWQTAN